MANIAIIKHKIEEDFVNFKLRSFFKLMYDYNVLNEDEYNNIVYGTKDEKKINLIRNGLNINLVNRLEKDGQLKNISNDLHGNLIFSDKFLKYKEEVDDFFRFELNQLLGNYF